MIRLRLQIGDGEILDTIDGYVLVYVSADKRFAAPLKSRETTSYPEEEGEHTSSKSVDDAFDYKVTWFVKANVLSIMLMTLLLVSILCYIRKSMILKLSRKCRSMTTTRKSR